jgi:hypothetical protein
VTLAWILSQLHRRRRLAWWSATAVSAAGAVEMVLIVGQVIRGRQSHFNELTAFDAAIWRTMGATIVALWLGTLVIAVLVMRQRLADRAVTWSVRAGVALALVGMSVGFLMIRPTQEQAAADADRAIVGAHSVGVADGGPGMPLTGWSTTGGDLRIPHFVGMHALQLLPLLALLLAVLGTRFAALRSDRVRLQLLVVASGGYAGLVALLTWQALRGQPLLRPDGATLAAAGALAAAMAGGLALVALVARRSAYVYASMSARRGLRPDDSERYEVPA